MEVDCSLWSLLEEGAQEMRPDSVEGAELPSDQAVRG